MSTFNSDYAVFSAFPPCFLVLLITTEWLHCKMIPISLLNEEPRQTNSDTHTHTKLTCVSIPHIAGFVEAFGSVPERNAWDPTPLYRIWQRQELDVAWKGISCCVQKVFFQFFIKTSLCFTGTEASSVHCWVHWQWCLHPLVSQKSTRRAYRLRLLCQGTTAFL